MSRLGLHHDVQKKVPMPYHKRPWSDVHVGKCCASIHQVHLLLVCTCYWALLSGSVKLPSVGVSRDMIW